LGERSIRFALNFAVMVGLAVLFVGPIPIHWSSLIGFAVALLLAFVLDFLGTFLVGLGAFWLEDTTGLLLIYSRLTMLLGGMLLPLDLFPTSWQPWLRLLPFSSILYGPAQMFVQPDTADMGALFLRQGIALGVLAGIVAWVYGIAVERIHANGG
jgi:ABC-2 type transport system permease protein